MELSVDVCDTNFIVINESYFAHSRSGNAFGSKASDSARAKNNHMLSAESGHTLASDEKFKPAETMISECHGNALRRSAPTRAKYPKNARDSMY